MKLRRTTILLPCQGLCDFPTFLTGADAESLIASWTALWHPELLAQTGAAPVWRQADDPADPSQTEAELTIIPVPAVELLPANWLHDLRATAPQNAEPIVAPTSRQEIENLLRDASLITPDAVDEDLVGDFYAFGYCYLQVERLSQVMQYHNIADADEIATLAVEAARKAMTGDREAARDALTRGFDRLSDARQHYYPVDTYFVNLTMLADGVSYEGLKRELQMDTPTSVLATGSQIEHLANNDNACLDALARAVGRGNACVVGGPYEACDFDRLPPEAMLDELRRGEAAYRNHLGSNVNVFGQFSAGCSSRLPQLLTQMNFRGAMLSTFDGESPPPSEQSKVLWQGIGNSSIHALSARPHDAGQVETYLGLSEPLSQTMRYDHVATMLLAGWPGQRSPYDADLARSARYGNVLGRFVTLDEYFNCSRDYKHWATCEVAGRSQQSPALDQNNPISSRAHAYRAAIVRSHKELTKGLANIVAPDDASDNSPVESIRKQLGIPASDDTSQILLNGWSFDREELGIRVPGLGFVEIERSDNVNTFLQADDNGLRNGVLEIVVSPQTGGIQSIKTPANRGTRVSQRIIASELSEMAAESVQVARHDPNCVEITSRGRITGKGGNQICGFEQVVSLTAQARFATVEMRLSELANLTGDPWSNYIGSRLIWNDAAFRGLGSAIRVGNNWTTGATSTSIDDGRRLVASDWVQIGDDALNGRRVALLPMGLPYHQRVASNMLDTLLVTRGENDRHFRFAIGLDIDMPLSRSLALIAGSPDGLAGDATWTAGQAGWFFHLSATNVIATYLSKDVAAEPGIQMRLVETEGRAVRTRIAAWKEFATGQQTDFLGEPQRELVVEEGQLVVELEPHQWLQLTATFA